MLNYKLVSMTYTVDTFRFIPIVMTSVEGSQSLIVYS